MAVDGDKLREQLGQCRWTGERFERLVGGEWVEWPVLAMDKLGHDEARRAIARSRPRAEP